MAVKMGVGIVIRGRTCGRCGRKVPKGEVVITATTYRNGGTLCLKCIDRALKRHNIGTIGHEETFSDRLLRKYKRKEA